MESARSHDTSRRAFLKAAAGASMAGAVGACAAPKPQSQPEGEQVSDPTVKRRTGPFGDGLPITIAGYDYGRVHALVEGDVTIEGCAHRFEETGIGPLNNHAFFGPQDREVTEIGLIPFVLAYCDDGFRDYVLLPIPVLRLFRHKSIFVRRDAGIEKPEDLRGRAVATVGYSSSGLTHIRGMLQDEYGVRPDEIRWISTQKDSASNLTGGVSKWEKVRPTGVDIVDAPENEDESSLLLSGKVDAIFHPAEPKIYQDRHPLVARLFEDHRSVERAFYSKTGMFPIMHAVAIRADVAKRHPWLPKAVFDGYSRAKSLHDESMRKWGWVTDSLPWYGQELDETRALMGDNFYPYGLKASASSFEAAFRYLHQQGLTDRQVGLEEVFEPSSLDLVE
ncbi:MAG: ABC transporter substrate-binding protein [Planctomycetota bacterium]